MLSVACGGTIPTNTEKLGCRNHSLADAIGQGQVIGQALTIIGRMRSAVSSPEPDAFRRNCGRHWGACFRVGLKCKLQHTFGTLEFTFPDFVRRRRQRFCSVLGEKQKRATKAVPTESATPTRNDSETGMRGS